MGWVRGKLGGPCALFVLHSDQRHSDGSGARKFSPPNKAWRESISTLRLTALRETDSLRQGRCSAIVPRATGLRLTVI